MKTHEKRALFSKAVLKATTCLFLAAGASVSPAFAFPEWQKLWRLRLYSNRL